MGPSCILLGDQLAQLAGWVPAAKLAAGTQPSMQHQEMQPYRMMGSVTLNVLRQPVVRQPAEQQVLPWLPVVTQL
jgi:hypothetical protein